MPLWYGSPWSNLTKVSLATGFLKIISADCPLSLISYLLKCWIIWLLFINCQKTGPLPILVKEILSPVILVLVGFSSSVSTRSFHYIIDYMDASTGCMIVHQLRVVRKLIDQLESLEKYWRWVRRCLSLRGSPPQILLSGNLRMEDMHIQDRVLEKGDGVFSVCLLVWGFPLGWK